MSKFPWEKEVMKAFQERFHMTPERARWAIEALLHRYPKQLESGAPTPMELATMLVFVDGMCAAWGYEDAVQDMSMNWSIRRR